MANFGGHILTRAGRNLFAKLAVNAQPLTFSSVKFGDGSLSGVLPSELTSLLSEKMSVPISDIKRRNDIGSFDVSGILDNAEISGGFFFREWGVFAIDPDTDAEVLVEYANSGETADYISKYETDSTVTHLEKKMIAACVVSEAVTVNTSIFSQAYASYDYVDNFAANAPQKEHVADSDGFLISDSEDNGKAKRLLWSAVKKYTHTAAAEAAAQAKEAAAEAKGIAETAQQTADAAKAITDTKGQAGGLAELGENKELFADATATADLTIAQVRNIYAGTEELTAGTSPLETGSLYLQYE